MKSSGKTIQIYLPYGNPRSLKIAEITSRTIQAILLPRSILNDITNRKELNNIGVYFLFGLEENLSKVYIGETENCFKRLCDHNKKKDFWTHALVFISKTQFFTKSHIKFLEWLSYDKAIKSGRYVIENSNIPTQPYISESVESDLYDNFETIQLLASTLGYPVFDLIKKPIKKEIIECKGKDAISKGEYTDDGLVVFKGSTCNLEETNTIGKSISNKRQELINQEILIKKDNVYEFSKNYIFPSPSSAAGVILARSANGWIEWKYLDGKTLSEVKRK